jgi:hypothetical protein
MGQGWGGFNGGGCFCLCVQGFDRVHAFDLAAFGPTRFLGVWVYIRFFGNGFLGFRPYGDSLFLQTPKKSKQKNACSCVRPARWGSGFLRCGIDPGAAPTVCFAAPPLAVFGCAKRSLRSHARINPSTQPSDVARGSRSRSRAGELTLGLLSGEEHGAHGFGFCGAFAPHPSPLPRERGPICVLFRIRVQLGLSRRRISPKHLNQVPSPSGRGLG